MTALEVLIDETAAALSLDPFEFRRRNALSRMAGPWQGIRTSVSVRTTEILDKLEKHPIWQNPGAGKNRAQKDGSSCRHRCRLRHQGLRYGRGLFPWASGNQPRWPDRDLLRSCRNGERPSVPRLANRGRRPSRKYCGRSCGRARRYLFRAGTGHIWRFLYYEPEDSGYRGEKNPHWVPAISSATSASIGAHDGTAFRSGGRARNFSLWPLAPPRSHCGISPRAIRDRKTGPKRTGKTGNLSCPVCRRWRCSRSLLPRMRAIS